MAARGAGGRFVSRDNGERALLKRIADAAKGRTLTVGVHEEEGGGASSSGLSIAEVATIHEFGLGQDQRSFVGAWADENGDAIRDDMRKLGEALVAGKVPDVQTGLDAIGLKAVGGMQGRISAGIDPPNKPATVAKKGSSTPLVDKGQLRSSIRHKVT